MGKQIAQNKKAYFNYQILDKYEAGIVLTGQEIKAIRSGRVNLSGSFARISDGEVFLVNMHINNTDAPDRTRKLLLNRREISHLIGKVQEKGLTLVPLELYLKKGLAKICLGLGSGKTKADKREVIKKRDAEREIKQRLKETR